MTNQDFSDCSDPTLCLRAYDGITDSAADEYFEHNTASIERVEQYVHGAFDAGLSTADAAFVFQCLTA